MRLNFKGASFFFFSILPAQKERKKFFGSIL